MTATGSTFLSLSPISLSVGPTAPNLLYDLSMLPHILEMIVSHITRPAKLLRLRGVSRCVRDHVDGNLARHLVVRGDKVSPAGLRGWHPRLRLLQEPDPQLNSDYAATARLVRRFTKIVDVKGLPSATIVPNLERLLEDVVLDFLRGERVELVYLEESEDSPISELLTAAACVVYRSIEPEDGPLMVNVLPLCSYKSVHHVTPSEFFEGYFEEFDEPEPCDFEDRTEVVFIFHNPDPDPTKRYTIHDGMFAPGGALAAMTMPWANNKLRIVFVNFDECVPWHAYRLPRHLCYNYWLDDNIRLEYHPIHYHLLETENRRIGVPRLFFVTLDVYEDALKDEGVDREIQWGQVRGKFWT